MKRGLLHARMPTLFAFLILFSSLWVTLFFLKDRIITTGRAGPDTIPHNIEITNITDDSFSVSFITTSPTQGTLSVSSSNTPTSLILDDRDKATGNAELYSSHLITVNRLQPKTQYSFTILANGREYLNDGKTFSVQTGTKLTSQPPDQKPLFGKILRPDGTVASDTIVLLQITNAKSLSVVTNTEGEYIIPTNSLRSITDEYFPLSPSSEIKLTAYWQNLTSELKTTYQNSSSLPTITLSNEYEFISKYNITQTAPEGTLSLPDRTTSLTTSPTFTIDVPSQNEAFVDKKPQMKGSAPADSELSLILDTTNISILANKNGAWTFRPTNNLAQGIHKITIKGTDAQGKEVRVTRDFEIFPEGSQLIESATPSATPRVSPTPTKKPTPSPTVKPTISPTIIPTSTPAVTTTPSGAPSSTPNPTAAPTTLPSPTATNAPSPTITTASASATITKIPPEKIPAGSSFALYGLIMSGLIITAGTLLFLLL